MGASPQVRIAAECARRGRREVVDGCTAILRGGEPDASLVLVLGGPPAPRILAGDSRADAGLWARVWAARGLLWALDDADDAMVASASGAVVAALHDPSWRVREKAAQVVARHLIDAALSGVVALRTTDPVARVRSAADRAVHRLTGAGG